MSYCDGRGGVHKLMLHVYAGEQSVEGTALGPAPTRWSRTFILVDFHVTAYSFWWSIEFIEKSELLKKKQLEQRRGEADDNKQALPRGRANQPLR